MQHRFYVPSWDERVEISGDEFHHARVVRLRDGEEIELFDGKGHAVAAVVESIGRDIAIARVLRPIDQREPDARLILAMAVIHLEKFELVLQKGTELGAAAFIPMDTARVEVRPERYRGKQQRWEKIVFEAVKQCGRSVIPAIEAPASFDEVIARPERRIVFDLSGSPASAPAEAGAPYDGPLILLVGPEGGWTGEELERARNAGCTFLRLGTRRLRAETAAIAALTAAGLLYGDLSG